MLRAKIFSLAPLFFIAFSVSAQQGISPDWQKAMVNAAGGNYSQGVDVFFKNVACGDQDQVILKFVNTNEYEVLIEWADAFYTDDKQWIHNERNDKGREIVLGAKQKIEGNCDVKSNQSLRVDTKKYLSDKEEKFKFAPSYIEVTKKESPQR
ncbi:MAG: hypothetical protein JKX73_05390 [Flavobacteriales bacterium]|nr:hypothetical protein [Flavobacteriales bacterium]